MWSQWTFRIEQLRIAQKFGHFIVDRHVAWILGTFYFTCHQTLLHSTQTGYVPAIYAARIWTLKLRQQTNILVVRFQIQATQNALGFVFLVWIFNGNWFVGFAWFRFGRWWSRGIGCRNGGDSMQESGQNITWKYLFEVNEMMLRMGWEFRGNTVLLSRIFLSSWCDIIGN